MSQLEELQKLQPKAKEFKLPRNPKDGEDQITIKFTALALDDIKLLEMSDDTDTEEAMKSIYKALAKSLSTEEEIIPVEVIGKLSAEYMNDLMDILMEVNKLDDIDKTRLEKAKAMIAKKKLAKDGNSDIKAEE